MPVIGPPPPGGWFSRLNRSNRGVKSPRKRSQALYNNAGVYYVKILRDVTRWWWLQSSA